MASEITGLSVKVSAAVSTFNAGMSRAQDAASDLSLSLRRLGMSSESAERDLDSTGRSATTTAAQMGVLTSATNGSSTAFMGLSAATLTALVPAMGTLLAALTPVVAALGGFIAIAGAIGGIGLVGVMGAIATNTEMLKEEAMETLGVFKEEFAPVFDLMASAIVVLLDEFEQIIPELVPAQQVVSQLTANFLELGSALIDSLPAFVDLATVLATEFLPPFVDFTRNILPEVPGFIRDLVSAFRRVMPIFQDFGVFLQRFLPELMEFGFTALPVVAGALGRLGGVMMGTLQFVNGLANGVDQLIAQASLIAPVLVPLVSFLGGPVTLALAATVAAVVGLAKAFQNNFANIQTFLGGLWSEFQRVLPAIQGAFDAFVSGIDFGQITDAVGALEDALGAQLMATLNAMKPVFSDFKTLLQDNKEEFRLIGSAVADVISGVLRLGAFLVTILGPAFRTVVVPALRTFIDAADLVLTMIGDIVEATQELSKGNLEAAAQVGVESTAPSDFASLVAGPGRDVQEGRLQEQINLALEGELVMGDDGELRALINQEASSVVDSSNRGVRRSQGRTVNPN